MITPVPPLANRDLACDALLLALVASKLRTAWHAGVMDAESAMKRLDIFLLEICSSRSTSSPLRSIAAAAETEPSQFRKATSPADLTAL